MKKRIKSLFAGILCLTLSFATACGTTEDVESEKESTSEIVDYGGAVLGDLLNSTYSVTSTVVGEGEVNVSSETVKFGDTVTFTFNPNENYVLASAKLNGSEIEVTDNVYQIAGAMRDYEVVAEFVKANIEVKFAGEGSENVQSQMVAYGRKIGKLPTPSVIVGKQFVGWENSKGEIITADTEIYSTLGEITLTAKWQAVEANKELYQPFSITTAYYDEIATEYGVVWHTKVSPAASVVLVCEGDEFVPENAKIVNATSELWFKDEYISQAVIDDLKYGTTYTVRIGDVAADVWSRDYTFTTREEVVEKVNFFYISDTQETKRIEDTNVNGLNLGDTYVSQVMREATARFPDADFIAHGGDIVNWGCESIAWQEMLGSLDEYLFSLPMMAVGGNHEDPMHYGFGRDVPHIMDKMFNINGVYDDHSSSGIYYSFDLGYMHFIGLRSNDVYNDYGAGLISEEQIAWFVNDANKAKEKGQWIITVMHEAPVNPSFDGATDSNTHTPTLAKQLMPLFDELDVDLLLYGHSHEIVTTYPLVWDENVEAIANTEATVTTSTKTVNKVTYDGVTVDEFSFEGVTNRGTVYHHGGTAGHQVNTRFKYTSLPTLLENLKFYHYLGSNGAGALDPSTGAKAGVVYPSYSYLEVTENSIVLRTYGVDVGSVIGETQEDNLTNHGIYIGGTKISR